jgi:hypothetical protein
MHQPLAYSNCYRHGDVLVGSHPPRVRYLVWILAVAMVALPVPPASPAGGLKVFDSPDLDGLSNPNFFLAFE